jgi:16S rRNA (uracil1498-N3)-methyltransferase
MPVFYTQPENVHADSLEISGEEGRHIHRVMRLGKGDPLTVVDGIGNGYRCEISKICKGKITAGIISRIRNLGEPSVHMTLAAGLSTGSKFDDLIQKGTELGVSRFIPLLTDKSKLTLDKGSRLTNRLRRWKKVAVASMKQSCRSVLPEIESPVEFASVLEHFSDLGERLLFDPSGDETIYNLKPVVGNNRYTIFIGPESGFSHGELTLAEERSIKAISLGERILRTENAAPVAIALVMQYLGEFR